MGIYYWIFKNFWIFRIFQSLQILEITRILNLAHPIRFNWIIWTTLFVQRIENNQWTFWWSAALWFIQTSTLKNFIWVKISKNSRIFLSKNKNFCENFLYLLAVIFWGPVFWWPEKMIFYIKYFILWRHLSCKVQITFAKISFACTWLVCTFWLATADAPVVLDKLANTLVTVFSADTFLAILKMKYILSPTTSY